MDITVAMGIMVGMAIMEDTGEAAGGGESEHGLITVLAGVIPTMVMPTPVIVTIGPTMSFTGER